MLCCLCEMFVWGEIFVGEMINYCKDGMEFNMEWQILFICDVVGKIMYFVVIQYDVIEWNWVERVLWELDVRYCVFFEGSVDGIVVVDIKIKWFKYVNLLLCWMFGYIENEFKIWGLKDVYLVDFLCSVEVYFDV